MNDHGYMSGARTKARIIETALVIWREGGESKLTARAVARRLRMTHAGVLYHFGNSTAALKQSVAEAAVALGDRTIVPQLIVGAHPAVAHLDSTTRLAYLATVN